MNRLGLTLYAIALAGVVLLVGKEALEPSAYLYRGHSGGMLALGIVGWLVATCGPLALSLAVWLITASPSRRWMLHAAFVPIAIIVFNVGSSILFYAAGVPDGDSIEGYTLLVASGFLIVTLIAHAVALAIAGCKRAQEAKSAFHQ